MSKSGSLEIDVAVIGSGAAGLSAALTARQSGLDVHIFEKADVFGGTTAKSGGVAWLPGNALMASTGGDSADDVMTYLMQHGGNRTDEARVRSFVEHAPQMLECFTANGWIQVGRMEGFPDYRAETPGGDLGEHNGGRSIEPKVFAAAKLADWLPKLALRQRDLPVVGTMSELRRLASFKTDWRLALGAWRAVPRTLWGRLTGARHIASGGALVGWLAKAARELGVELHLSSPMRELVVADGRVCGVEVEQNGELVRIVARRAVILASGGFDHNAELRRQHLQKDAAAGYSSGAASNTGDGQLAARDSGAALSQMDGAWFAPTCLIPDIGPQIVIFERGKPGQIIVGADGKRFANEAQPYGDFVLAMIDAHSASGVANPAFMVFDQTFRDRYPTGPMMPGRTPQRWIDNGFLTRADSLEDLAAQLSVDAIGLRDTVRRFNVMAHDGVDDDFKRGESAFDRYSGDPSVGPNPCLAPIEQPPFYAIRIVPGDLGTNGGVLTNEFAQALDEAGVPIPGLYAAGNCAASVLGGFYPGAGGTIGPAMTYGYIAALHAAGKLAPG